MTPETCRRFLRWALRLNKPFGTVDEAIRHHGYVQIDPIDVCGRMHDLILRNRVRNYQRDDLLKAIHARMERAFFEHYTGVLVALPIEDYRYLIPSMKRRRTSDGYGGALDPDQKRMARRILDRIRAEGPLGTSDFANSGRSQTGWGTQGTLAKTTLDKLFFHGQLLITRRDHFRRVFDLPERVLPESVLKMKPATPRQIERWHIALRLRQRRLITLSKAHAALVDDLVIPIKVADQAPVYCLKEDVTWFDQASDLSESPGHPRFLAPLDPLIYDRRMTRRLWDFDYTWEVYTPAAKRARGYYALPVLEGTRLVGYIDPKVDRATKTLQVRVEVEKGIEIGGEMGEFARFLSTESVTVT